MAKNTAEQQAEKISSGYTFEGGSITLGAALVDGQVHREAHVRLPLKMMNRHGLVAGATGTGKTITLQVMAEQLSTAGVPVFLADVKGDLTGLSTPGAASDKLLARTQSVGMDWQAASFPVGYYSLGGSGEGVPIRATVSSFGPVLLARIMELNETQESSLLLVFHYADQQDLELYDLRDLRAVIQHLVSDKGKGDLSGLGGMSKATAGVILRGLVTLEAKGMDQFFGEPEFDTTELLRVADDGRGVLSCLELPTLLQQPLVFSTFLIWLLADLFEELPEVGDADKPKLVFFLDEAHLLFKDASKAFMDSITTTVRLIRSKGVGVFFITQTPQDVPGDILGQLANRVQHALRAFTPDDAKALKATVSTFPTSDYDLEAALTQAGTGEAIVVVMNEQGAPTPVAWTRMWSPRSTMGASPAGTVAEVASASPLMQEYGTAVDRESAFEVLASRQQADAAPGPGTGDAEGGAPRQREDRGTRRPSQSRPPAQQANPIMDFALQAAGILGKEFMRGMFGTRRRRRR
ncbi:MAG TPA: helicase HerA-like domain-containing protein [Arthrobacter sp.]|nr:helicase HerA-like domain-containing protein [Arthrobacter sp.]